MAKLMIYKYQTPTCINFVMKPDLTLFGWSTSPNPLRFALISEIR